MAGRLGPGSVSDEVSADEDLLDMLAGGRPEWMRDALCREYPKVSFFPARGGSDLPAKRVCARCLVRLDCREWAI